MSRKNGSRSNCSFGWQGINIIEIVLQLYAAAALIVAFRVCRRRQLVPTSKKELMLFPERKVDVYSPRRCWSEAIS